MTKLLEILLLFGIDVNGMSTCGSMVMRLLLEP